MINLAPTVINSGHAIHSRYSYLGFLRNELKINLNGRLYYYSHGSNYYFKGLL